jgi:hypothetical protein
VWSRGKGGNRCGAEGREGIGAEQREDIGNRCGAEGREGIGAEQREGRE